MDRALAAACRRTARLCFADARSDMNYGPGAFEGSFMRWGGWVVQDGTQPSLIDEGGRRRLAAPGDSPRGRLAAPVAAMR